MSTKNQIGADLELDTSSTNKLPLSVPANSRQLLDSLKEDVDVATWINETLLQPGESKEGDEAGLSREALKDLDQTVTHLVALLEIACQDTSMQLEHTIDEVTRGMPRLAYDLHFMKDSVLSMHDILGHVQSSSTAHVSDDMTAALETLQSLDTVKGRMEAAREVLREAESWSTLEMEVTSLLAEQGYEKAAERLSEANKSMVVFEGTPEYESRRALMVSLQNQLEASLSAALVSAISTHDVQVCKHFYAIFVHIQRESEFRNYYNGSRRASIIAAWQNAPPLDCDEAPGTPAVQALSAFLPSFYAECLSVFEVERTSVSAIFPDPPLSLSTLISSAVSALQPTFAQRLASLSNYHGTASLKEIIAAFKATEDFARATETIFTQLKQPTRAQSATSSTGATTDSPQALKASRRRSARMSVSWRSGSHPSSLGSLPIKLSIDDGLEWCQDIFQPFLDFQVDYSSLESRLLLDELSTIRNSERRGASEPARILREQSMQVFALAEESQARCTALTHGYGSVGLVEACDRMLRAFLDDWTGVVKAGTQSSATPSLPQSGQDLSDLDYSVRDWALIQSALHFLAAARAFYDRMSAFEGRLRTYLAQVSVSFGQARAEGVPPDGMLVGEDHLLSQSTLHSAELHDLLSSVDPDASAPSRDAVPPSPAIATIRPTFVAAQAKPSTALLATTRNALTLFTKACQLALTEPVLAPLLKHLAAYPTLAVWTESKAPPARDVAVPEFSRSPTDIMSRVAEGLLNLPRLFEIYATDDALAFALDALPHIRGDSLHAPDQAHGHVPGHSRRTSIATSAKPAPLSPEAVSSTWLYSLGHTVLAYLTSDVLPGISALSRTGAAQLAADLAYLSTCVRALGVESAELERWREATEMEEAVVRERVRTGTGAADVVLLKLAKMRGFA